MASALLLANPTDEEIKEFTLEEEKEGYIVKWEDRKLVWAERCFKHEIKYMVKRPSYIWLRIKRLIGLEAKVGKQRIR
jgi:hypothetical protein